MSLNQTNNLEDISPRITNLDFLRGIFIILALDQHFTYYINMWYVEYFRDAIALTSTYKIHFPMIGQQVASDVYNHFLAIVFTPWVSQIYLTMAAFNLAKRNQEDFAKTLPGKLKMMGLIFLFFVAENFIVAPNFGQAISFYPIMLWMVVLSIIAIVYRYAGLGGVLGITIFSCMRFVLPMDMISGFFQDTFRETLHPGFEYDARLEYFILSGCLGFIMGYVHYHKRSYAHKKDLLFGIGGSLLVLIYCLWGDRFIVDYDDFFRTEHDLAQTFSGTCYILGVQAIVISFFLWLERKKVKIVVPVVNWVGNHSLLVFGLHRILFVRILAPIAIFIGSMAGFTLGARIWEIYIFVFITLAICYFIKKSKITEVVLQQKG
jgi:hypothetical protein